MVVPHKIPSKPWQVIGADLFTITNCNFPCVVDYNGRFPILRKVEKLSAASVIKSKNKYGLPRKYYLMHTPILFHKIQEILQEA